MNERYIVRLTAPEREDLEGLVSKGTANARVVRLMAGNLDTPSVASLHEAFEPETARRLTRPLEFHHPPKHGSGLKVAEIELKALSVQCSSGRIADLETPARQVAA